MSRNVNHNKYNDIQIKDLNLFHKLHLRHVAIPYPFSLEFGKMSKPKHNFSMSVFTLMKSLPVSTNWHGYGIDINIILLAGCSSPNLKNI